MIDLHLHLILNKKAGSGNGLKISKKITTRLKQLNIIYHTYTTDYQGHAMAITKKLLTDTLLPWKNESSDKTTPFPLLVVVGGDGTLHEVINALANNFDIPLGYIPAGSGNDFARGVNLSQEPLTALNHLLTCEKPQRFNLLHYHNHLTNQERWVNNNVGIGIDAAIVSQANHSRLKKLLNMCHLGSMSYLLAASFVIFKQKGFPLTVEFDGKKIDYPNALLCTTTNHPYFGGGLALDPLANPQEANMSLIVVDYQPPYRLIGLAVKLLRQTHFTSPNVHHYRMTELKLSSSTAQFGQADGEELGQAPLKLTFSTNERFFWL